MKMKHILGVIAIVAASVSVAQEGARHDEGIGIYVGLDGRERLTSGTYAEQANPNFGRLTFLYDHGDHFHGIGTYSLTGPADAPTILPTNSNNRLPETFSLESPLPLTLGSGLFADTLRSRVGSSEYSHLGISSIHSLSGFPADSVESILYHSSDERWIGSLATTSIGLKLMSVSPGLHVGTETNKDLFKDSDTYLVGPGGAFDFLPTYWVDSAANPGTYSVELQLVDLATGGQPAAGSGSFFFDFAVTAVPEPSALLLLGLGLALMGRRHWRK